MSRVTEDYLFTYLREECWPTGKDIPYGPEGEKVPQHEIKWTPQTELIETTDDEAAMLHAEAILERSGFPCNVPLCKNKGRRKPMHLIHRVTTVEERTISNVV